MKISLKSIRSEYPNLTIEKTDGMYGYYRVILFLPYYQDYFWNLRELKQFLDSHFQEIRQGNCL